MEIADSPTAALLLAEAEKIKHRDREATAMLADKAIQLSENGPDISIYIRALILAAYCSHHRAESQEFFSKIFKAIDLLENHPDPVQLSYAKYLVACGYRNLSDYENAAENFLQSLHLAEEIGDTEGMIRNLNGLGHLYDILGNPVKAQELYVRGLELASKECSPELIGHLLGNQANSFVSQGRLDEARENLEQVLEIFSKLEDRGGIGLTRSRIAKIYIEEGKTEKALEEMKDVFDSAVKFNVPMGIAVMGNEVAQLLITLGRAEEAKAYLDQSYEIAKKINYLSAFPSIYKNFYRYYKATSDDRSALEWHERYHELRKKIDTQETASKLKNAEALNEIKLVRKQAEIDHLKHIELRRAYEEIEIKNKEITDSIHYARRIQQAMLPTADNLKAGLQDHFVFFLPRDIVSGDFFWFSPVKGNDHLKIIAVADCTGHGVPGALMSMICSQLLTQAIAESRELSPGLILNKLDKDLCYALNQKQNQGRDGMDISVCVFNSSTRELTVSSAMRPVLIWKSDTKKLDEIVPTKRAIGNYSIITPVPFIETRITLNQDDRVFMFTDGFPDQFGGPKGKKMMVKNFKALLSGTSENNTIEEQCRILESEFHNWKNGLEQVDDVTVLGFAVK